MCAVLQPIFVGLSIIFRLGNFLSPTVAFCLNLTSQRNGAFFDFLSTPIAVFSCKINDTV